MASKFLEIVFGYFLITQVSKQKGLKDIELSQLTYFKAAAEHQNLTKAAEALYISQPALSKAIQHLETELGTPLFERQGKSVTLNDAGKTTLDYVNNIFMMIDSMKETLSTYDLKKKPLILHTTLPNIPRFLLTAYSQDSAVPPVQLQCANSTAQCGELLKQGFLDIAITSECIEEETIENILLLEDYLMLMLPAESELLAKEFLSARDLDGIALAMPLSVQKDYQYCSFIQHVLEKKQCKVTYTPSQDILSTNYLLEISDLCSISSALTSLFFQAPKRVGRIIGEPEFAIPYYISYRKEREHELSTILNRLRADFDSFNQWLTEMFPFIYKKD